MEAGVERGLAGVEWDEFGDGGDAIDRKRERLFEDQDSFSLALGVKIHGTWELFIYSFYTTGEHFRYVGNHTPKMAYMIQDPSFLIA